jgi:hypothetical protein
MWDFFDPSAALKQDACSAGVVDNASRCLLHFPHAIGASMISGHEPFGFG